MGVLRDIFAGNTAVIDITFIPSGSFGNVTALNLRIEDPNKIEYPAGVSNLGINQFRGTYNIPDAGPNGVWVYRWESVSTPDVAGEQKFNVVGSSFLSP